MNGNNVPNKEQYLKKISKSLEFSFTDGDPNTGVLLSTTINGRGINKYKNRLGK